MSSYIDGFILPIPADRLDDYRKLAETASEVWRDHGALEYCEFVLDDADAHDMVSYPQLAGAKDDEVVMFAWARFESKEARDEANKKIMFDERLTAGMEPGKMFFDYKRMAYGGFRELVRETK